LGFKQHNIHILIERNLLVLSLTLRFIITLRILVSNNILGGLGGVHRGAESSFDISADLKELGRNPIAVISAGVKSILDIGKTLEYMVQTNILYYFNF